MVLAGLVLPISNLVVGLPEGVQLGAPGEGATGYAEARDILARKCSNCHTSQGKIPFYANFPVARDVIQADIEKGTRWLDLVEAFSQAPAGPVSEVALAKIELTLAQGTMPPAKYLALHWNGGLSGAEVEKVAAWIRAERARHHASPNAPEARKSEVLQPLPEPPPLSAQAKLGEELFHDVRLSGDNTVSCASCHGLDKGGTDQAQYATGVGGQMGGINSPTVFNAGPNLAQFWDGRAADLQAQAAGPVANPIEMAAQWPEVIEKLKADQTFAQRFGQAYPKGLSQETVTHAIAAFEETLVTPGSDFDRFLLGDEAALSESAKAGYRHFRTRGCASCHVGETLGGQSYEVMSRYGDYFGTRGNPTDADLGRFGQTKEEKHRHAFKVPTLRNVALTHPYFHDGTVKTLEEATRLMGRHELGVELPAAEVEAMVAFLKSLTGTYRGKKLS